MDCIALSSWVQWLYLFCFCIGLFYGIFVGIFSGFFGGHEGAAGDHGDIGGHGDAGGHAGDIGHGGDVTQSVVAHGEAAFSPLSPIVLAMFLASFGGAGLITSSALRMVAWLSVSISVVAGFGMAALTFLLFYKLVQATQASSEATVAALVGETAEVITAIPRDGLGEIAYVARGSRYNAPARSDTGAIIPAFTQVVIRRIAGNTFFVAPKA